MLLLRLRSDLLPALLAACDGELAHFDLRWHDDAGDRRGDGGARLSRRAGDRQRRSAAWSAAAAVPGARCSTPERHGCGRRGLSPPAGRVLTVCATGETLRAARDAAYAAVRAIDWPDGFCRRDIGWRALVADA